MLVALAICLMALSLDQLLGEPRRFHPLVGFGRLAESLEQRLNRPDKSGNFQRGALAAGIILVPPVALSWLVVSLVPQGIFFLVELLFLYLAIGMRSLADHAHAVVVALEQENLPRARASVGRMVSRDTAQLDSQDIARAGTESVLENGSDAVIASLFWFLVAGLPGLILHRLVNTLDAMWGYRNARFDRFGRFVARLDDLMGLIPARLTALGFALAGECGPALRSWWQQGRSLSSPNAGPVMAAGAGALGFSLGGPTSYDGGIKQRPILGLEREIAGPLPIDAPWVAVKLLRRSVLALLTLTLLGGLLWRWTMAVA